MLLVKVKSEIISNQSKLFHLFLSDSGGCGKSKLIKNIYHAVNKVFWYRSGYPVKPRILLLAPTGVATININGYTKYSGLHIPCRVKLLPLNNTNKAELRDKYSEVELVNINETFIVSGKLFYQIHTRLNEVFSSGQDISFWVK